LDPERVITSAAVEDAVMVGDHDALKQVLLILMDNGLKHTTGTVRVTARAGEESVTLRVHDDGPGIPSEMLPHVFERFQRGGNGPTRSGLGLGLAIAKALVEAQGGTISVDSHVDTGSTFAVALPKAIVE
jgi:signal transduction histidine kinase